MTGSQGESDENMEQSSFIILLLFYFQFITNVMSQSSSDSKVSISISKKPRQGSGVTILKVRGSADLECPGVSITRHHVLTPWKCVSTFHLSDSEVQTKTKYLFKEYNYFTD